MAKSDARFGYKANFSRNSFDLSKKFGFTAAPGMLLPIFADIASPGDSYYIQHDLTFLRSAPMAAPAMIDVKVHFESFFVPFQMIYQPIEQTLFSLKDFQSSNFNSSNALNNNFPTANLSYYKNYMINMYNHSVIHSNAFRFADMMGLNADAYAYDSNNASRFSYSPNIFPWQMLAYSAIYNYFYRLDDKSDFSNGFNWDSYYSSSSAIQVQGLFTIFQRAWDFDYFTSMYRSPIVSNENMQNILREYNTYLSNSATMPQTLLGGALSDSSDTTYAFSHEASDNTSITQFVGATDVGSGHRDIFNSTALIRQMFANEKLSMITGRARKTYDSQILAHFGVEVPHDPKHDIAFIGADTYNLHIGEVTSLSATSDAGLGDLAGKGWSQGQGKKLKFTCPCHGVVMTIFSIEPEKRYFGGFDKINALTNAFDLPTPEFDRLGNVPMFRYETGERAGSGVVTDTDIIGWKERYYQYKRQHNKVTLAFMVPRANLGYNSYSSYMISSAPFGAYTATNNNTARPDLESRFYIDRNCMDAVMLTPYIDAWQTGTSGEETTENWNAKPWLAYSRDPFIVDSFEKVTKVSWMSKDGEPIYNF